MIQEKKVMVLGAEYVVTWYKPGEDGRLETCDGYTDFTVRKIAIAVPEKSEDSVEDMGAYVNKVVRHEIVHAFLMESGLMQSTNQGDVGGAFDEQNVDWFAIQGPKIYEAWRSVGAV